MTQFESINDTGHIINGRQCPKCGEMWQNKIVESRTNRLREKDFLVRRRECLNCGCRWSTVEVNRTWYREMLK